MASPKTLICLLLLLPALGASAANFFVQPIDIPYSIQTAPASINDRGDIVGFYYPGSINDNTGFLIQNGQLTTFNYPGANFTEPVHINNDGEIFGKFHRLGEEWKYFSYQNDVFTEIASLQNHGIPAEDQDFSSVTFPGAGYTTVFDANDKGDLVGSYQYSNDPNSHGFAYINGTYISANNTISIFGINNAGLMVGHSTLAPELGAVIAVPEPSAIALLVGASGILGLAHACRRKNRSKWKQGNA